MALVAAGAPAIAAGSFSRPGRKYSLSDLRCEDFARHIGTPLRINSTGGKSIKVKLTRARMLSAPPKAPGEPLEPGDEFEAFSVLFSGRRDEMLGQETYTLEHESLGRFDCFIVPVYTEDQSRINYEMVCSRWRRASSQT